MEVYEAVAVLVDLADDHLQFLLLQCLAENLEDLIEFLRERRVTLMEIEPEPSWSKMRKALRASSSSFLVRYFLIGSFEYCIIAIRSISHCITA